MKTCYHSQIHTVDVHAALARAQADRAEYVRTALAAVPAVVKRLATQFCPNHRRLHLKKA
jgi:hypothetical protein